MFYLLYEKATLEDIHNNVFYGKLTVIKGNTLSLSGLLFKLMSTKMFT